MCKQFCIFVRMRHQLLFTLLFCFSAICRGHGGDEMEREEEQLERRTLMISLDAFRWDYPERIRQLVGGEEKSNIWRLIRSGTYAPRGVTSAFTTMTFPNHYTLVTGLYEESHGVVSNLVYDPILNRTADLKDGRDEWVYGGEPIWKTIGKQSHEHEHDEVGCVMWVACRFSGLKNFMPYDESKKWDERVDTAIRWLVHDAARLVLVYYHEPDRTGHIYGPNSAEMNRTLMEVDDMIGQLIKKLETNKLFDKINLLVVSDHGMSEALHIGPVLPDSHQPQENFVIRSEEPALWLVEPYPGRHDATIAYFKNYQHLKVIEKADIPDRWHYKNNPRITPLLVLADPGYALSGDPHGIHGYDNEASDMRPTFIAHGPAFITKSNVNPDMGTVDVYLLLCFILGVKPAPNNGTAKYLRSFLRHEYFPVSNVTTLHGVSIITMAVSVSVSIFALFACLCHWHRSAAHKSKAMRDRLFEGNGYLYRPLALESVGPLLTTAGADLDSSDDDNEQYDRMSKRP